MRWLLGSTSERKGRLSNVMSNEQELVRPPKSELLGRGMPCSEAWEGEHSLGVQRIKVVERNAGDR